MSRKIDGSGLPPPKPNGAKGRRIVDYGSTSERVIVLPFFFKNIELVNPCKYTIAIVTIAWLLFHSSLFYIPIAIVFRNLGFF